MKLFMMISSTLPRKTTDTASPFQSTAVRRRSMTESKMHKDLSPKGKIDVVKLNKEERDLSRSVEKGEWRSTQDLAAEIKAAKSIADATIAKTQRMNIRIAERDLIALRLRAMKEGLPYQTLVCSIIHKYLAGRLVEKGGDNLKDIE
jgi:predicted DNA binding CopG/RHH family protein